MAHPDLNFNTTIINNTTTKDEEELPISYRQITTTSSNIILVYSLLFLIGASGNLSVFLSVSRRQLGKLKWRITVLILHLSLADLIVICVVIPSEVIWKSTIQWYGGNLLCKICQFGRAFGLYLSSMVIICISIDRLYAIVYPLRMVDASQRVKVMLSCAWIFSAVCAFPQVIVFSVQRHPKYQKFQQCVTYGFLTTEQDILVYNLFSVSAMYFIPLCVIVFAYSMILWKIVRKSKEHHQQSASSRRQTILAAMKNSTKTRKLFATTKFRMKPQRTSSVISDASDFLPSTHSITCTTINKADNDRIMSSCNTRDSNEAAVLMMARAKWKILRLTCVIVIVFLLCWTPYVVMLLWYLFDRESAQKVNVGIQDGLFMMAVANSCVNPFVYGNYTRDNTRQTANTHPISRNKRTCLKCWFCGIMSWKHGRHVGKAKCKKSNSNSSMEAVTQKSLINLTSTK